MTTKQGPDRRIEVELVPAIGRWVEAGLLDHVQGERIRRFEDERQDVAAARATHRGSPAEALGYVGAALAVGAIALLLGELWDGLLPGGRLALVTVLTAVAFGGAMMLRGTTAPALERLASVLATLGVAGVGWATTVVTIDIVDVRSEAVAPIVGSAMLLVALVVYVRRPRALLQLTVLASLLLAVTSAFQLTPTPTGPGFIGVAIAGVGLVWGTLAIGNWLSPRAVAQLTAALVLLLGIQVASFDDLRATVLLVGVAVAGLLVAAAVRQDAYPLLLAGALGLFGFTPQLVLEWFGDTVGGPASMLLVGLLLVVLAVGLGRARQEVGSP